MASYLTKEERTERRKKWFELYQQGYNDNEAARVVGVTRTTIRGWRNQLGLPSNHDATQPLGPKEIKFDVLNAKVPQVPAHFKEEHDRRLKFHRDGLSDGQLAKAVGASKSTIYGWRFKYRIPANQQQSGDEEYNPWMWELRKKGISIQDRAIHETEIMCYLYGIIVCNQSIAEIAFEHKRTEAFVTEWLHKSLKQMPTTVERFKTIKQWRTGERKNA